MANIVGTSAQDRRPMRETTNIAAARAWLDSHALDQRSVFVGNLPVDCTEEQIKSLFVKYGTVLFVGLHKQDSLVDGKSSVSYFSLTLTDFQQRPPSAALHSWSSIAQLLPRLLLKTP